MLRAPVERCAATGIELGATTRVVVMPDQGGVAAALRSAFEERGATVELLDPAASAEEIESSVAGLGDAGPVTGLVWLAALDDEGPIDELDAAEWQHAVDRRVRHLAVATRALTDHVGPPGTFLVGATRLGGRHGFDGRPPTAPLGGGTRGFTKAIARERPDALVKVVDHAAGDAPVEIARRLVEEITRDPGAVEVGYADGLRWGVGLVEAPAAPDPAHEPGSDAVVVVTGAAGGIVSAIVADLAQRWRCTFHLLDLVPAPDPDDPDVARFTTDRDGLKADLAARITERGDRATPVAVERELARVERAHAAADAIRAVRDAGGTAQWHAVDLTDPAAVDATIAAIAAQHPRVDVLLHAAGLEISRQLPDKPQSEFDLVFGVKAGGWHHLLRALRPVELGTTVVFSSVAGRFGNAGQTDYSAANDLLCATSAALPARRAGLRPIAIDWTAWAGIGMASRGSIPRLMEMAGIDMLPPDEGVPVVAREVTAAGPGGEVLVAGALGVLGTERPVPAEAGDLPVGDGVFASAARCMSPIGGVVLASRLDPVAQPFLNDHRIDGTPVLPGVMGIEAFAEAARALAPGWHVRAVEDVDFHAPFKFYRDEPRTIEVEAFARPASVDDAGRAAELAVECRLIGRRAVAGGEEQETVHFTGRVRLGREPLPAATAPRPPAADGQVVEQGAVYGVYFHGPAYQVVARVWPEREDGGVHHVGELAPDLPPDRTPADLPLATAPRLLELCFQTAGVAEIGATGRLALPTHLDRLVVYEGAGDPGELLAVVAPGASGGVDGRVVDGEGRVRLELKGYRTIELPGLLDDAVVAPFRAAVG